jgi:hypothetical protein
MNLSYRLPARILLAGLLLVAVMLLPVAPAQAQTRRGDDKSQAKRGRIIGRIKSIRKVSTHRRTDLVIETGRGRFSNVALTADSQVNISQTDLTTQQATAFLATGVMVEIDWIESQDRRTHGRIGSVAERLTVRSQWIEGDIRKTAQSGRLKQKSFIVSAVPGQLAMIETPPPAKITVRGRREPKTAAASPPAAAPKPRIRKLSIIDQATTISLDGKTIAWDALATAVKKKDARTFEALIVDGSALDVVELHAYAGELRAGSDARRRGAPDQNDRDQDADGARRARSSRRGEPEQSKP